MKKVTTADIKAQYRTGVDNYAHLTKTIGLWQSEHHVFCKYLNTIDTILDLGCGTGRTTFPLYQNGYQHITGVDFVPEMIDEAKRLNAHFNTNISFEVGDARSLRFENKTFDGVIFSFTGLMSIPGQNIRDSALSEIGRVLITNGLFIFTTYDRDMGETYFKFWQEERARWDQGNQRKDLFDFGDIITPSKNESSDIYIHIPNQEEIQKWLKAFNFEIVETFYRPNKFEESEAVKASSGDCRFWVAQKT